MLPILSPKKRFLKFTCVESRRNHCSHTPASHAGRSACLGPRMARSLLAYDLLSSVVATRPREVSGVGGGLLFGSSWALVSSREERCQRSVRETDRAPGEGPRCPHLPSRQELRLKQIQSLGFQLVKAFQHQASRSEHSPALKDTENDVRNESQGKPAFTGW